MQLKTGFRNKLLFALNIKSAVIGLSWLLKTCLEAISRLTWSITRLHTAFSSFGLSKDYFQKEVTLNNRRKLEIKKIWIDNKNPVKCVAWLASKSGWWVQQSRGKQNLKWHNSEHQQQQGEEPTHVLWRGNFLDLSNKPSDLLQSGAFCPLPKPPGLITQE